MLNVPNPKEKYSSSFYSRWPSMLTVASLIGIFGLMTCAPAFGQFTAGNLVVSRSVYEGTASTVAVGQPLPPACPTGNASCVTAVANGTYPGVWANAPVDGSFGVTSPIFLDQLTTSGSPVNTTTIDATQVVTSFSSKSELGLNLSTDRSVLTFMGYTSSTPSSPGINALDVSNSNTPLVYDPTNPVGTSFNRGVVQLNGAGSMQITLGNAYSGNNGRAAILANGLYYTVGNSNNGTGTPANVVAAAGVQFLTPSTASLATQGLGEPTDQVGSFSVTQVGDPADKAGKDNNFRGLTIFNNTLYITKGSGSNGIDTVYQVGSSGSLPTTAGAPWPINILPGFPTATAKKAGVDNIYPFGVWFANPWTLYVGDEGDGTTSDAALSPFAGLQKWTLINGTWRLAYVMQNGLNLGQQYSVPNYPANLNPATDGLRNITGRLNEDGTVTIWAVSSTVSANGDTGADPNLLVTINDVLDSTSPSVGASEKFSIVKAAGYGEVLRGVSFTPGTAAAVAPASITLQVSKTSLTYPGATSLSVCVASAAGPTATGSVQILDGTTILTTQPLEGNGCANWYITPGLSAGVHPLTALYSGDEFNTYGTSNEVTVTVGPTSSYLSPACGNSYFSHGGNYVCNVSVGSNAGSATGSITYTLDGGTPVVVALTNGSAQFSLVTPGAGAHTVTISYAQQGNFAAAGPNTENFTVTQAQAQVALTPSNYYPAAGSSLTLSASVTSYSAGAPASGSVTFFDNGTSIDVASVNAQGQASFAIPSLASGYHSYTAQFGGTANYAAGSSNYLTISAR